MIKGKYVATIELNFNVDESTDGLLPFETLQAKVTCGELDKAIVAVISDEFGELCTVGLNKQYADLYLVDGRADNGKAVDADAAKIRFAKLARPASI